MPTQYTVATDGASNTNHMKACENSIAGWGAVIVKYDDEETQQVISGKLTGVTATNQVAELVAAVEGVKRTPKGAHVELLSDSKYVLDGINEWMPNWKKNGWKNAAKKPVKHKELWQELDSLVSNRDLKYTWVKGHSGHELNELADSAAREAMA